MSACVELLSQRHSWLGDLIETPHDRLQRQRRRFLLPREWQVFDATLLGMHGLRVERHQLEYPVRDLGADRQTEFSRLLRSNRIVVRPSPGGQFLRQSLGLFCRKAPGE